MGGHRTYLRVSIVLCLFGLVRPDATAQADAWRFWIRVTGRAGETATMIFGNAVGNTFGIDSLRAGEYQEFEPPPPGPGFDCIWGLPPGHTGAWGTWRGLLGRDWRGVDAYPWLAQVDTFVLKFLIADAPSETLSFRWPDPAYLLSRCDSIMLFDPSGSNVLPNNRLDMASTDTLTIPAAGDLGIVRLHILKYGLQPPEHTGEGRIAPPPELLTVANYPNPFNPSTSVVVRNSTRGLASLRIYDVLGRLTASLFEGILERGRHEFMWDAAETAAGVYLARLTTAAGSSTIKLLLAR